MQMELGKVFQKSIPQYMVCETIILICWLEGDVFRIRVQGRYKAFEEENMSHDLLLSSKYYVKRNFLKRTGFF